MLPNDQAVEKVVSLASMQITKKDHASKRLAHYAHHFINIFRDQECEVKFNPS